MHLNHGLTLGFTLHLGLRLLLALCLGRVGVNGVKVGHSVGF